VIILISVYFVRTKIKLVKRRKSYSTSWQRARQEKEYTPQKRASGGVHVREKEVKEIQISQAW
jgi:hypothetical protein